MDNISVFCIIYNHVSAVGYPLSILLIQTELWPPLPPLFFGESMFSDRWNSIPRYVLCTQNTSRNQYCIWYINSIQYFIKQFHNRHQKIFNVLVVWSQWILSFTRGMKPRFVLPTLVNKIKSSGGNFLFNFNKEKMILPDDAILHLVI